MSNEEHQPVLIEAYDHEIEKPSSLAQPQAPESDAAPLSFLRQARRMTSSHRWEDDRNEVFPSGRMIPNSKDSASAVLSSAGGDHDQAPGPRPRKRPRPAARGSTLDKRTEEGSAITNTRLGETRFEVEPRPIAELKRRKNIVDHSYRDFSCVPPDSSDIALLQKKREVSDLNFPEKVHDILSTEQYKYYISWMPHGRAFRVLIPKRCESKVFPKYFNHSRYSTFLRQLSNYGFKHITEGADRNCYYHEAFLRGLPHLLKYMPRPKNARRLAPDVANEPDFYRISEAFPLPDFLAAASEPPTKDPQSEGQAHSSRHGEADAKPPAIDIEKEKFPDTIITREEMTRATAFDPLHELKVPPENSENEVRAGQLMEDAAQQIQAAQKILLGQVALPVSSVQPHLHRLSQPQSNFSHVPDEYRHLHFSSHVAQGLNPFRQYSALHDSTALLVAIAASVGSTERILGMSDPASALRIQYPANPFSNNMLPPFRFK